MLYLHSREILLSCSSFSRQKQRRSENFIKALRVTKFYLPSHNNNLKQTEASLLLKSSIPTYIRYRLYVKLIFLCYIYMYYIYNILINSSPLLPRAVLRFSVAKSDCADGQMQQPKEQGFHCNILVHCIAMNYVEWCLPSVSNSFPHHNVSTSKTISLSNTTVCKTLILPVIDTWTTISSIQAEFRIIGEENMVSLSSPNSRVMSS